MPKAPLVFKLDCFLKLSDFFFWDPKTQRGLFHRFLKLGCKPVLFFLFSLSLFLAVCNGKRGTNAENYFFGQRMVKIHNS